MADMAGHRQEWQSILDIIGDSAADIPSNFVPTLKRGVQALTNGDTDQVCLVREGNALRIMWSPTSVLG